MNPHEKNHPWKYFKHRLFYSIRSLCVRACLCAYRFLWANDSECTLHTQYTISPPKRVCCVQMYFIPMPAVYPYACICVCIEFACTVCVEHSALLFYQNNNKNNQYRIWRCFFNLSIWVNCTDDVCNVHSRQK